MKFGRHGRQIEKGTHQLPRRHSGLLADPARMQSYLAGRFPGAKAQETKGVVSIADVFYVRIASSRAFPIIRCPSATSHGLSKVVSDGIVGMTALYPDGSMITNRFRIISEQGFSTADFDDFLSDNSKYFNLMLRFMHQVSRFERLGNITVARDTVQLSMLSCTPGLSTLNRLA